MHHRHFLVAATATLAASAQGRAATTLTPLEALIVQSGFAGTACVTRGSTVLLHRGFGPAERSFDTPCAPDTRYRIASITKLFTSTLIAQLASEGKVDLDKPIGVYLPHYAGPAKDRSTLPQLLHHTSGIQNFDKGLVSFAEAARAGMPG